MTPTPEQQTIIEAAKTTSDNLLVAALAGAAKTSTLVMIAKALPTVPTLCLAFNKRIATEMQDRLPGNCTAMTLNSLGHRTWGEALGKRLRVDTKKSYNILKTLVDELPRREKEAAYDDFSDTLKTIGLGKSRGYIPTGRFPQGKGLMEDYNFFDSLDEEPTELQERLIREATITSIEQAMSGLIDFDDQIFMPTLFPASFHQYPLVLIDEAQDLSALNHATLRKMAKKRLIAVGDECQSIYGFRGAHEDSMSLLERTFNMRKLVLSVSFRCPIEVIKAARWRAPHMQWPDWAKPGAVEAKDDWTSTDLPDTATILCRNNAPIFNMAINLLKAGRYSEVVGNDVGKSLMRQMKKFGPPTMPQADVMDAIERWKVEKLKKSRAPDRTEDMAECLRVFARNGKDLQEAIAYAEHLMSATGTVKLMTIHKAKGLEFDTVFLLDKQLVRTNDHQQERNLLYVAQTRAKERLVYVETEGFQNA